MLIKLTKVWLPLILLWFAIFLNILESGENIFAIPTAKIIIIPILNILLHIAVKLFGRPRVKTAICNPIHIITDFNGLYSEFSLISFPLLYHLKILIIPYAINELNKQKSITITIAMNIVKICSVLIFLK